MCLDAVNTYGNNPIKLLIMINTNKVNVIIDEPWYEEGPNRVLNSECNFPLIMLKIVLNLLA